jgi:hypothetical protein
MHNPGFKASSMQTSAYIRRTSANQGQQLRSPAGRLAVVIHWDLVGIPSSEVLRASLQLRFPAGRLEFPRVINADRASSMHNPGSMGQDDAQPWIHGDLVGIPSSYRLRDGLQLRSQREGTRCTTLDPRAGSMHNHGSQGRKYAQPRIQGQQYADVCKHWEKVCKPRSAVCKHSENVCKPRPAAAIPCGPVGSCDPWGLGWSSLK